MTKRERPVYKRAISRMLFSAFLFVLFAVISTTPARAGDSGVITLEGYLRMVSLKHPLFEREGLSVDVEESLQSGHLGSEDWIVRASGGFTRYEDVSGGITPEQSLEYASSLSMERSIWKTGGSFKAEINNDYTKNDFNPSIPFNIGPSEFYESSGRLTYSQPLLKNRGGVLDRLEFDLAKYSIDMARLQTLENKEAFTLFVALKFMHWVLLTEKKGIAKRRLALAIDQFAEITKRREANLVDEVDKLRALDSKEIARANLLLAEADWKVQRAELAILAVNNGLYGYEPAFDLYETALPQGLGRDDKEILYSSRVIRALNRGIARLERERRALINAEKADLSLDASVAVKGGGDSLTSSAANDGTDASLKINLAYPLGNRSANAEVKRVELLIRQAGLERDKLLLELHVSLKGLSIQIEEFANILKINSAQIMSARARTTEELKRYNQGRGEFTFVIQSQDSEERAMLNYANNAARYHSLVLELRALTDDLLQDDATEKATDGRALR